MITILYFLICPFEFVNYDFPNIGDQLEKKKKHMNLAITHVNLILNLGKKILNDGNIFQKGLMALKSSLRIYIYVYILMMFQNRDDNGMSFL